MTSLLYRLGHFAVRRRWFVLVAWLVALGLVGITVRSLGAETSNNLNLPGTDSLGASQVLGDRFSPQQNGKNPLVFRVKSGKVTDSGPKQAITESHKAITQIKQVYSAPSPFGQQGSPQISKDGRTTFIPILLKVPNEELTEGLAQRILDAAEPARKAGLDVAVGGQIGSELSQPETESSELVGLTMAMIILALTFGSLVAMGLPILSAVFGLMVGLSLIGLLGHIATVPDIGPTLATMIGLGVGIDYALFLLTRYRGYRQEGRDTEEAIASAVATSGSAIVFAGSTVIAALIILLLAGIPLVTSLGYAAAVAVVTAVLASITLLPAILAILGPRYEALRLSSFGALVGRLRPGRGKDKAAGAAVVDETEAEAPQRSRPTIWERWGRFTVTHPWLCVLAVIGLLILLALPTAKLDLGQEDVGATPKETTERQAYDLITEGFGVGYNGPLLIAAKLDPPAKPSKSFESQMNQAKQLQQELEQEQAEGESQKAELTSEAAELTDKQAQLEAEGASLESQAKNLEATREELERQRAALDQQRTLRSQLDLLTAQARNVAAAEAELARQIARIGAELAGVQKAIAVIDQRLATDPGPVRRAELERRRAELVNREASLRQSLDSALAERGNLQKEAHQIASNIASLRDQAAELGGQAEALAAEAAATAKEAASLASQKSTLEQEAASAQVQAANLEAQKAQLEAMQQVAQIQQQQAEQLKASLTKQMTKAGGDERGTDTRLVKLQNGLTRTLGVDLVSPPDINKKGDAAIFTVIASTPPADPETADLVRTIRNFVIPQQTAEGGISAHVGGQTASYVDLANAISSRLPLVIFAVIALGFLVLMVAFHSLLIPAQAALANLLSVAAAFGVLTAFFQFGWGISLVGLDTASGTDPIASFVPLIMFAVLFGLSMDYQVFLVSEVQQQRESADSELEAVANGVARGARVIGSAALIMIAVFASFLLNGDPTVKQFGVGLSVGVALAAIAVLTLAPAILTIADKASWWLPDRLKRILPSIDLEGGDPGSKF